MAKEGFRVAMPAANGSSYEIIESDKDWLPILDHKCRISPWCESKEEAIEVAKKQINRGYSHGGKY